MNLTPIELSDVRVLDVLRNSLNSELGVVIGIVGDKLDLFTKTGEIVRFKFGVHFIRVSQDEAISFRALTQSLRRQKLIEKPRRKRTVRKKA